MLENLESPKAGSLRCWYARKPGSYEDRKLRSLIPYRFPVVCSELPAINWQFKAIASRPSSLAAFPIVLL
jgi:hypothetical protein